MKTRYEELLEQYGVSRECPVCNGMRGIHYDGKNGDDMIFTLSCQSFSGDPEVANCSYSSQHRLIGAVAKFFGLPGTAKESTAQPTP